jgi:RNA polymerase-interacting CarD/CdnL/TRCF family regulator
VQHIRKVLQQRKQFLQDEIKLAELLDAATAREQILEQLQV